MAKKPGNRRNRRPLDVFLSCDCGAKARVSALGTRGFMAHCAACGTLTFFKNADLLERVRYGGPLCPHKPERKPCPGGHTTWCLICRVRTFYRD
ncbi:MAG: hypothetical protein HYX87_00300 [Chloroflexi bacterium]|nr:hypothetical protein [Chloroflexota bacterium]